jgi:hypothetical protein
MTTLLQVMWDQIFFPWDLLYKNDLHDVDAKAQAVIKNATSIRKSKPSTTAKPKSDRPTSAGSSKMSTRTYYYALPPLRCKIG